MPSPGMMTRYDIVGVKEDVSDIITNLTPTETPFLSSIGTEGIDSTRHDWQEDSLLPVGTNAQLEGFDAIASTQQPTVMRSNTTQILSKTASASGTADRVKKYGRAKELSYQLGMRAKEIKKDLENVFVGVGVTQVSVVGSNTVPRQMAGVQAQIASDATVTVTGPLVESTVTNICQTIYTNGSDPKLISIKPEDATRFAAFKNSGRTTFVENDSKKISAAVEVYESPYGTVKVVKNRIQKKTDAIVYDPKNWKRLVLRDWFRETLAKTGDSTRVMMLGEFSLKHTNYHASGLLTALT